MVSSSLAASLGRRDIHYGWVTFLTMLVTAGAVGAPGVFIVPLQQEFGWQTAESSSALAIRLALFGLLGPFAAAFMNHFGVRSPNGADYARVEALPAVGLCAKRPQMIRFGPLVDHARAQRKGAVRRAGLTSARAGSTMPPVAFVGRSQRETDQ